MLRFCLFFVFLRGSLSRPLPQGNGRDFLHIKQTKEPAGSRTLFELQVHSLPVDWNRLMVERQLVKDRFAEIMK